MTPQAEAAVLKRIVTQLSRNCGWGHEHLPCDYLVLDIETTGFSCVDDRVVSLGMCAVRDCAITHDIHDGDHTNIILKWPEHVFVGKEKAIEIHGIDYAKSQREGVDPVEAMGILSEAIQWARRQNMFIVGHNLQKFDAPFLREELSRAGIGTRIENSAILDTAALCKAMQLSMIPGEDEKAFEYFDRVMMFRAKGVFFNLDRYCIARFGLGEKYGASKDDAHNSGYDCWLTHLVLQELNNMVGYIATPF